MKFAYESEIGNGVERPPHGVVPQEIGVPIAKQEVVVVPYVGSNEIEEPSPHPQVNEYMANLPA